MFTLDRETNELRKANAFEAEIAKEIMDERRKELENLCPEHMSPRSDPLYLKEAMVEDHDDVWQFAQGNLIAVDTFFNQESRFK